MGEEGRLTGAELSDGTILEADVAIIGIGVLPNTGVAEAAGLEIENDIKVNAQLRSSDPSIFAIGDCTSFPHEGRRIRLESVGNAIDQAQTVAKIIAGHHMAYKMNPWFWSDQFGVKLQIAGLSAGYETVVTRAHADGSRSHWYYADDKLMAIDAINDPSAHMICKRLIKRGKSASPEQAANPAYDLKQLITKEL